VEAVQKINHHHAQEDGPAKTEHVHAPLRNGVSADAAQDSRSNTDTSLRVSTSQVGDGSAQPSQGNSAGIQRPTESSEQRTFVHDIFCGKTVTHTRCMNCEAQSQREENFMELTLDVEQQDTTLEQCMLAFRCATATSTVPC
jgi:hypothetical protein